MCGITLLLERDDAGSISRPSLFKDRALAHEIESRLRQRGPDHYGFLDRSVGLASGSGSPAPHARWKLRFCSAVLHLRGDALTPQPMEDADGNILCWNGEVFGYHDVHGGAVDIEHGNDTRWLSEHLHQQTHTPDGRDGDALVARRVVGVLERVHGPFAFVWFHAATQRVFFGHDRFGRRSLLFHTGSLDAQSLVLGLATSTASGASVDASLLLQQRLALSSVALSQGATPPLPFDEVPSTGVFELDVASQRLAFHVYEPLAPARSGIPRDAILTVADRYNCGLPHRADDAATPLDVAARGLLVALSNAVGVRVRTIPPSAMPRVGVLFSGGLDSVVLAALVHFHVADPDEPIELLTVCFDAASQFRSPDRRAALVAVEELRALFPTRAWRLVRVDVPYECVLDHQREIRGLLAPCDTHMDLNIGAAFWFLARGLGQLTTASDGGCEHPADLNAFLHDKGVATAQRDAEAAVQSLGLFGDDGAEQSAWCPATKCKRKLKPGCTLGVCRVCCLKAQRLLATLRSAQDERAAFASRKQLAVMLRPNPQDGGSDEMARLDELVRVYETHWPSLDAEICRAHRCKKDKDAETTPTAETAETIASPVDVAAAYAASARVLLVGIGADEQLGGYGRHKTAFLRGGSAALRDELARDMQRIWKRNLGRDDRCISAHGREARFPFLDERVVRYIASLPLECVCDFERPRGDGDKRVLRAAARRLGLASCAALAKRAIQFGSRIAKHANVAAFGSNRQASGDAKIERIPMDEDERDE